MPLATALYPTPENPLPAGAECLTVKTRDGVRLRGLRAIPDNPRGTVVLIGGRGDFIERYFETMLELQERGFAVASFDLRGQGGSARPLPDPYRARLKSFAEFDEDIRAFMESAVLPHCPRPFYALGHSTGGHVLLRVLRQHGWFRKVVLVSPLVDVLYGTWPRPLAAAIVVVGNVLGLGSRFLPGQLKKPMGRGDFPLNPLTSDAWRWNRDSHTLEVAPHLGLGGATFSWFAAARRSLAAVARARGGQRLLAPVLIVASGADQVVAGEATRRLARRIPGIALTLIPGARHEILSENDHVRQQFFAAFDSFVGV